MKFETSNGAISFPTGVIQRTWSRTQFLKSPIGLAANEDFVNQDWRHYHIEPENGVVGTVLFDGERMDRIFLSIRIPGELTKEWTAGLEHKRKARHDDWLLAELGRPPYRYPWGQIVSEFDAKDCVSEIIIAYDR